VMYRYAPGWLEVAVVAGCCLLAWLALLPATHAHIPWVYSWDSVAYVEAANSIASGKGPLQRIIEGTNPEIWQPMTWWPPGYPLLITPLTLAGIPSSTGCVVVSYVAGAASVVLLAMVALRFFHWMVALPLTLTFAVSVPFQTISTQCMSDTTYLALVLASTLCLALSAQRQTGDLRWMLAAGVFAGAAWVTRNVGLALFAATGLLILLYLLRLPLARVVRLGAAWVAGIAVSVLPFLAYNLTTFGQLSVYNMRQGGIPLWEAIRLALVVCVREVTSSWLITNLVVNKVGLALLIPAAAALIAAWVWRNPLTRTISRLWRSRLLLFLLVYAALYIAIVIAARSQYRWGPEYDFGGRGMSRYMLQTYWIAYISLVALATALLSTTALRLRTINMVLGLVFLGMAGQQIAGHWGSWAQPQERWDFLEKFGVNANACALLKKEVGKGQIVFSTQAYLLRLHCDVNARGLPAEAQSAFRPALTREDIERLGSSGVLWGFMIEDVAAAQDGTFGSLGKDLVDRPESITGLRRVAADTPAIIVKYNRP
jgi:Dolichyl-phosphate-mannose-protein mannosyltransferase